MRGEGRGEREEDGMRRGERRRDEHQEGTRFSSTASDMFSQAIDVNLATQRRRVRIKEREGKRGKEMEKKRRRSYHKLDKHDSGSHTRHSND